MTEQNPWKLFWKAGENVRKDNKKQGISEAVLCAEYEAVYRYALSLCRDDTEAQDITQETFLRAMKTLSAYMHKRTVVEIASEYTPPKAIAIIFINGFEITTAIEPATVYLYFPSRYKTLLKSS